MIRRTPMSTRTATLLPTPTHFRSPCSDPSLAPVATGSHLDTQPPGGKFDGVFGVLAGLEVIRTLNDNGIETAAPIEVAVWTNEEGSRFAPAMIASGVFAGVFDLEYGHSRKAEIGRASCRERGCQYV